MTDQLNAFRSGDRKNEQMNIIAQDLTDAQIRDLAAWYSAIEIEATVPGR
ncbi:c-type cytochrome [Falsiroseomonas sp. HW251]